MSDNHKKRLGDQPGFLAAVSKEKHECKIGFLLPDVSNPLILEMTREVENYARKYGLNLLICHTDSNVEKEERYVSLLIEKGVDGFIFAGNFRNKKIVSELLREEVPVILLSDSHPHLAINTVTVDNFMGGYELTNHLISLGHTRIAVIAEDNTSSYDRIRGSKQAFQDHGLAACEDLIFVSDSSVEHAQRLTEELLAFLHPPTAVIACNDVLAIGTLLGAREKNVKVPEQLSITGFDNTLLSRTSDPPLTTVEVPVQSMSSLAVDLLVEEVEKRSSGKQVVLTLPRLVIRESTGPNQLLRKKQED